MAEQVDSGHGCSAASAFASRPPMAVDPGRFVVARSGRVDYARALDPATA